MINDLALLVSQFLVNRKRRNVLFIGYDTVFEQFYVGYFGVPVRLFFGSSDGMFVLLVDLSH